MKTTLTLAILFLISISSIFGQQQNLATIVDESPKAIDLVFISKLGIMAILGIIAFFSYLKFRKTN
jgi:hypothetical protein